MKKLEKLGKYEIRRVIGEGAMGIVYEAFDPLIERAVAIKTILKSTIDKHDAEEIFSRFRREARAAGRLSHPKIVAIYEYGEVDEMAFIVMELIHGKELKEYFDRDNKFSIGVCLNIVMQLLDALDYSHARGVVHRDIKPANIMITDEGQIKIADFGIAKIDTSRLTQTGVVMGTPSYMPPEQFLGLEVDHRADIYAVGVILYQFLTGQRPFSGSIISIMHQAVHQDASPPSKVNPAVSELFDNVVQKAMAKRPEARYQSAAEFMEALKAAAQTSGIAASSGGGPEENIVLADTENSGGTRREDEISFWRSITNSHMPSDFTRYLEAFPDGEFAELANLRLNSIEKTTSQAKAQEEQEKLNQEARERAALASLKQREALEKEAMERAQAKTRELAEAESRRKKKAVEKERLARRIAELKIEAEAARVAEEARRKKDAIEKQRRAKELFDIMSNRSRRLAEIITEREAIAKADQRMKMEAKRKLEESLHKKNAGMSFLSKNESAVGMQAATADKCIQHQAELSSVNNELTGAIVKAEAAEMLRRKAEARIAQAQKLNRPLIIAVGAILLALLIGAWVVWF